MVKKIIDGKEVEVSLQCPYFKCVDCYNRTWFDYCVEDVCAKWDNINKQCSELTQANALAQIALIMAESIKSR